MSAGWLAGAGIGVVIAVSLLVVTKVIGVEWPSGVWALLGAVCTTLCGELGEGKWG